MKLTVIGGAGLIGSQVVGKLTAAGHQAVPAALSTGLDLITGQGLDQALEGAEVVINVANSPRPLTTPPFACPLPASSRSPPPTSPALSPASPPARRCEASGTLPARMSSPRRTRPVHPGSTAGQPDRHHRQRGRHLRARHRRRAHRRPGRTPGHHALPGLDPPGPVTGQPATPEPPGP
jgi:hypothetical protein